VKITEIKLLKYVTDLKKKVKKEGGGRVKKLTDIYEIVSIFSSHGLKASANYVRGLQSFFQARYNEAK